MSARYALMLESANEKIAVETLCSALQVSRSGFYQWCKRDTTAKEAEQKRLVAQIKEIHKKTEEVYGAPRVHEELQKQIAIKQVSKSTVARAMRRENLSGLLPKRWNIQTTDSNHSFPIAPRIFKTEDKATHPTKPNQIYTGDIRAGF